MHRPARERLQDEHVERARQEFIIWFGLSHRQPTGDQYEPVSHRLSMGKSQASLRPLGASGIDRSLCPVAAKMAFATAGASPTIGVSPDPAGARSLRSSITVSITGRSVNRGTRYFENRGFRLRPFSNSTASKSAPPTAIIPAPSTWFFRCSGLTTAP